jgi:hypothetical protein
MRRQLELTRLPDQPADPADRRDQLGDGVLGGDRVLQDGGVQHPPPPTLEHPGRRHDLANRIKDPPGPRRRPKPVAPVHQHRGVEPLVVQPQPTRDLPGDVTPQRADRLPVRPALQRLQHQHAGDHLSRHRRVPATLTGDISEQLWREQLVTVVGKKRIHRPVGDQVTTPGRRVHLVVGGMVCWAHTHESACAQPLGANPESARSPGSTTTTETRPFSRLLGHRR